MLKHELAQILKDQKQYLSTDKTHIRRLKINHNSLKSTPGFVHIITGVRRSGKSTFLKSLLNKNTKQVQQYLHFDDPRLLNFQLEDFYTIEDICGPKTKYYYDELHEIKDWERYIRQANERKIAFIITGSNATMLSGELATLLTGRHLSHEIFPFDHKEYCLYHKLKSSPSSVKKYLLDGGFPEFQKFKNPEILRQLLKDIIERDIIARYEIRDSFAFYQIAMHLVNNIARPYTLRKLARSYGIGSVNTVSSYVKYLENAYLFFTVNKFDYSFKKQQVNEKKIYAIDTGFVLANSIKIQDDHGRLFENMIFLYLRQNFENVYYFKDKGECDFIVTEKAKIKGCYQVCLELDRHNKEREINGVKEAMEKLVCKKGYIVTMNQDDTIKFKGGSIKIISADKMMT